MKKKTNCLIFMCDQMRRDAMPGYGMCKMPNLERFAASALQFDDTICVSPHCCPSRASFFSGLYPSEHGVWNNVEVGNALSRGLTKGVRLISQDLKENGYSLYFAGKWHVSDEEGPADRGFEVLYDKCTYKGIRGADEERVPLTYEWESYEKRKKQNLKKGEGCIQRSGYPDYTLYGEKDNPFDDETVIESAVNQIKTKLKEEQNPWLMFVGTKGPHDPYKIPKRFLDLYKEDEIELPESYYDEMKDKPALYRRVQDRFRTLSEAETKEAIRHYRAFCSYEDYLFGKICDALRDAGLYEDTAILFLSDHGDYAGAHGLFTKGLPCFLEAYSIPLMIHYPGGNVGRTDHPATIVDLAPTILDICKIGTNRKMAGSSLFGLIEKNGEKPAVPAFRFTQTNGNETYGIQRAVLSPRYVFVYNGFDYDELYDLEKDPYQMHNLISDPGYEELKKTMMKELWRFAKLNNDTIVNPYIFTAMADYGPGILFEEE